MWSANRPGWLKVEVWSPDMCHYNTKALPYCGVNGVINLSEVVLFTFLGSFLQLENFMNIEFWSEKFYKQFTSTCIGPINPHWWCHFDVICHLTLNSNPGYLSSLLRLHHCNNSYREQDIKGHYFDLGHWLRFLEKLPQLAIKLWSPNINIQILWTYFHKFP